MFDFSLSIERSLSEKKIIIKHCGLKIKCSRGRGGGGELKIENNALTNIFISYLLLIKYLNHSSSQKVEL